MARFAYFSGVNVYVTPYSSVTDGGELVTEFNQRAALNVLGWKEIDLYHGDPGIYEYAIYASTQVPPPSGFYSYLTGTQDQDDFQLSVPGSNLRIAPGIALVKGYYVQLKQELLIPASEIISAADMQDPANAQEIADRGGLTRYVKLRLITTQAHGNPNDERLVPPYNGIYEGVEILTDRDLPRYSELLLGTVFRDVNGAYSVINNTLKTRILGIEHIAGAENYANLVESPEGDFDTSIYGVQKYRYEDGDLVPNDHNLININQWTWLGYTSVLGKYLRNMARVPDDAGRPGGIEGDPNLNMLGSMIGRVTPEANATSATLNNKLIQLITESGGDISLAYRTLLSGNPSPDCYGRETVPIPKANYTDHLIPNDVPSLSGRINGVMDARTLWQVDQLWADRDLMAGGRQFGPFETKQEADAFFATYPGTVQEYDYYWVLSDTIKNYADPNDLTVNYGTISTTFNCEMTGTVNIQASSDLSGNLVLTNVDGTAHGTATPSDDNYDPFDVDIEFADGTINASLDDTDITVGVSTTVRYDPIVGTVTGTGVATATATLDNFTQNVSARYVWMEDFRDPQRDMKWIKQCVIRGFASPATPEHLGFVKPSDGNSIGDVIVESQSGQLKLDPVGTAMLKNGGWVDLASQVIYVSPEDDLSYLSGKRFAEENGSVLYIHLTGNGWDATTAPVLRRVRGRVYIYTEQATLAEGAEAAMLCDDVDCLYIMPGGNVKINTTNCVVDVANSNAIYRWVNTRFTSGSNTAVVNNPWMTVNHAFSNTYENSLQVRFATITRGEYNIESAEMDIWIKREDWTEPKSIDNFSMVSINKLKFPPLYLELNDSGQPKPNPIFIPDSLNAKVSGTGGTHRTWDDATSQYVLTGNWISTIDWENGEEFSINGRMLSPNEDRIHGLKDIRFRVLVQFTEANDMVPQQVDYSVLYPST